MEPSGIVKLAGTCAADVLLLCKVTTAPPEGAGPFKVNVPLALAPPTTTLGVLDSENRTGALTVRVAVLVSP